MQVDVIGAVTVRAGDQRVSGHALGGRRARLALVALALTQAPVSAERLAEVLWQDTPPPSWQAALRGVIRSLRTAAAEVGLGGQTLVMTVPSGYALAPGVEVDVRVAQDAVTAAETLLAQGRHRATLAAVGPALQLDGRELLPGEDLAWLEPYRQSVEATRRRALEMVAEAAGELGEHHRATQAARLAVSLDPMDERAHRALIRALDRAGDRAGAVLAFEECRATLAEQLGVDPSRETVDAYLTVLRDQPQVSAGRLPGASTSFVGRDAEVTALHAAVQAAGVVTVTGKGGVGKSRLALEVARLSTEFTGGRYWVSLAPVSDDELVASSVALELGVQIGASSPADTLAAHLAPLGRVQLVLDGCEAVLDGTASLVSRLLETSPLLTLVVTSRRPLAIEGERVVRVAPLPEPEAQTRQALASSPQVRLLLDRVRQGGGELAVDAETAPLIALLCLRCGGLPLALELVAAQLTAMSIVDLLDHLSTRPVDEDDQVRAVLRRSYALLDPAEAEVFRVFAVLDGPVGLPLIRQVTNSVAPVRVIRILRELTTRGLLLVDRSGPRWRYLQDDDVHRFAGELLRADDEESAAFGRLGDAVRGLLPDDPRQAPGSYQDEITDVLGSVRSYLGAALDGRAERARGLEIAFRLHRFWAATDVAEGRFWLGRLLADDPDTKWTGLATFALGYLSYWSGDADAAVRELESAVELLNEQDDAYVARALIFLGGLADDLDRGGDAVEFQRQAIDATERIGAEDLHVSAVAGMAGVLAERVDPRASGFAVEAIELCRAGGSAEQLAATLPMAAMVCWQVGDFVQAHEFVTEGQQLLATGRRIAHVVLLSVSAGLALADGDAEAAADFAARADAEGTDLGVERELPLIRCLYAWALLRLGDLAGAAREGRRALQAAGSLSYTWPFALCLETSAVVGHALGHPDQEALVHLLGCADAIRTKGDRPPPPSLRADLDLIREQLGPIAVTDLSVREARSLAETVLAAVASVA